MSKLNLQQRCLLNWLKTTASLADSLAYGVVSPQELQQLLDRELIALVPLPPWEDLDSRPRHYRITDKGRQNQPL